jgi:mannose-6-phosphate isomerase class I
MNHVSLTKGQALIIPGSQPHCYLSGQGIECMPCSDNIVRCGLTRKECNPQFFFTLSTQQPVLVQTTSYHHPCLDPYFSLYHQPCLATKNSIVLVLKGEGTINHVETCQGDSWIVENDQPILFDPNLLHVITVMPCT